MVSAPSRGGSLARPRLAPVSDGARRAARTWLPGVAPVRAEGLPPLARVPARADLRVERVRHAAGNGGYRQVTNGR